MPRVKYQHNTFNAGIISKRVQGSAFNQYDNALDNCLNFIIQETGGAFKRPGSYFVYDITNLNIPIGKEKIISWRISSEKSYVIIPSLNEAGGVIFNVIDPETKFNTELSLDIYNNNPVGFLSNNGFSSERAADKDQDMTLRTGKLICITSIPYFKQTDNMELYAVGGRFDYLEGGCVGIRGLGDITTGFNEVFANPRPSAPKLGVEKYRINDPDSNSNNVFYSVVIPGPGANSGEGIVAFIGGCEWASEHKINTYLYGILKEEYQVTFSVDGKQYTEIRKVKVKYGVKYEDESIEGNVLSIAYHEWKEEEEGYGVCLFTTSETGLHNGYWKQIKDLEEGDKNWNKIQINIDGEELIGIENYKIKKVTVMDGNTYFLAFPTDASIPNNKTWISEGMCFTQEGEGKVSIFDGIYPNVGVFDIEDVVYFAKTDMYIFVGGDNPQHSANKTVYSNIMYCPRDKLTNDPNAYKLINAANNVKLRAIIVSDDGNELIAIGDYGAIVRSKDGINWHRVNWTTNFREYTTPHIPSRYYLPNTETLLSIAQSGNYYVIIGVKGIYWLSLETPDASYLLDDFTAINIDNELHIFGTETAPVVISEKGIDEVGHTIFEIERKSFTVTPMTFEDSTTTLYPNFNNPNVDGDPGQYLHNGGSEKYKLSWNAGNVQNTLTPYAMPVKRNISYDDDGRPIISPNQIFAPWPLGKEYPVLPSDVGDFVCLTYKIPGDTIKYESWWFRVTGGKNAPILQTEKDLWHSRYKSEDLVYLQVSQVFNGTEPPGDYAIGHTNYNHVGRSVAVTAIADKCPVGADNKIQMLPWAAEIVESITKLFNPTLGAATPEQLQTLANAMAAPWRWYVSACSDRKGYFKSVCLHENRLWCFNTKQYPRGYWASAITGGDYYDFTTGTNKGDAIQYPISPKNKQDISEILWGASCLGKLFIGTNSCVMIIGGATLGDDIISPDNVADKDVAFVKCSSLQPVPGVDSLIFTDSTETNVYEVMVDENSNYKVNKVSVLSSDLFLSGVRSHCITYTPFSCYWNVVNDGSINCLTINKNNEMMAWHNHKLGNPLKFGNDAVCDVCAISNTSSSFQENLFMIVNRKILAGTDRSVKKVRYLEQIQLNNAIDYLPDFSQHYVDCGIDYVKNAQITKTSIFKEHTYIFPENVYKEIFDSTLLNFSLIPNYYDKVNRWIPNNDMCDFRCYFKIPVFKEEETNDIAQSFVKVYKDIDDIRIDFTEEEYYQLQTAYYFGGEVLIDHLDEEKAFAVGGRWIEKVFEEYNEDTLIFAKFYGINDEIDSTIYVTKVTIDDNLFVLEFKDINDNILNIEDVFQEGVKLFLAIQKDAYKLDNNAIADSVPVVFTIKKPNFEISELDKFYIYGLDSMPDLNRINYRVSKSDIGEDEIELTARKIIWQGHNAEVSGAIYNSFYDRSNMVNSSGEMFFYFDIVTGLNYFNYNDVSIYSEDGDDGIDYQVVDGTIRLDKEHFWVAVGSRYTSLLVTLPLTMGSNIGSSLGAKGRQNCCILDLYRSTPCYVSENGEYYESTNMETTYEKLGYARELFSGLVVQLMKHSQDNRKRKLYIKHNGSGPCNILSVTQDVEVYDPLP